MTSVRRRLGRLRVLVASGALATLATLAAADPAEAPPPARGVVVVVSAARYPRPLLATVPGLAANVPASGCLSLTEAENRALGTRVWDMVARGDAEWVSAGGTLVTRISRPAAVVASPPLSLRLEVVPRFRDSRLELELRASGGDAESDTTCTIEPPGVMAVPVVGRRVLLYEVAARLKRPARERSRSAP